MFLTVNTELLTMLMTSLARDADALGSIKVEVEVEVEVELTGIFQHKILSEVYLSKITVRML